MQCSSFEGERRSRDSDTSGQVGNSLLVSRNDCMTEWGEVSFFESPRAPSSAATHWKSQRGGVALAEMCVRRDTSLAAGQRCSLYSPPPSSASNSPRVCLLAWIPNTFCRSQNTPGKLIVVRITPPTMPPPAESYLRQHLNLKRKKPPSLPPSLFFSHTA